MRRSAKISIVYFERGKKSRAKLITLLKEDYSVHVARTVNETFRLLKNNSGSVLIVSPGGGENQILRFLQKAEKTFPEPMKLMLIDQSNSEVAISAINAGYLDSLLTVVSDDKEQTQKIEEAIEKFKFREKRNRHAAKLKMVKRHLKELQKLVDEKKLMESIYIKSEAQFHSLLENSHDAVIVVNEERKILIANAQSKKIFGYDQHELIGQSVNVLIPEGKRDVQDKHAKGYFKRIQSRLLEQGAILQARHKDGHLFPTEISLNSLKTGDGTIVSVTVRDVTERVKVEAELAHHRDNLEKLVKERTEKLEKANRDIKENERKILLLKEVTLQAYNAMSEAEIFEICISNIAQYTGWPIGHVYLPSQRVKNLLVSTDVWYLKDEKKYDEFCKITQSTNFKYGEGLPGQIWKERKPVWIKNVHKSKNFIRKTADNKVGIKGAFGFPVVTPDSMIAILEFFSCEEEEIDKDLLDFVEQVGIQVGYAVQRLRSVSELRNARDLAEKAKSEAEDANRSKSTFLANMSHEIRTPMNAVLGFTEILSGLVTDPVHKNYLASISSSGKSLLGLINDILDLSKVEAGKLEFNYKVADIYRIFSDMEQIFALKVTQKAIDFIVVIEENLPRYLVIDEMRLRQVLLNLVGNAVKFCDSGYVKLSVHSRFTKQDSSKLDLEFSVEDTGIGVERDQQELIFRAFEQQKSQNIAKYGGTGLGLSITNRLIEMMNGEISIESEVGIGSTFKVILHDVAVSSVAETGKDVEDKLDLNAVQFERQKILVVDDVAENRFLVKGYLQSYDFDLLEAENGEEAIDIALRKGVDLALMDIKMPVMDGIEATKFFKSNARLRKIPVIAVTASALRQHKDEAASVCDGFLIKPVGQKALVRELMEHLTYTVVNKEGQAQHNGNNRASGVFALENLSEKAKEKLPELLKTLETKFRSRWEELQKTTSINEIEDFSQNIQRLGKDFDISSLINWGESIEEHATMFDMDALETEMKHFPEIVDNIRSIAR